MLDALPSGDPDDRGSGSPIVETEASQFDYLVEDDGLLITTRLKVLATKETRVYSLKNLKDSTPDQLSTVIRHGRLRPLEAGGRGSTIWEINSRRAARGFRKKRSSRP